MSVLSDLLDFVKTREPDGASFGEIQGYLEITDKIEVRNLINEALDKNYLVKLGERRGTRYICRSGASVTDDNEDVPIIGNKALETYLNDATPVYDAIVVHIENIVTIKNPEKLLDFLKNGRKIITYVISFDHEKKRNVIAETTEMIRMNYFVIKAKEFTIEKFDEITGKKEIIGGGDYEELREELLINLR